MQMIRHKGKCKNHGQRERAKTNAKTMGIGQESMILANGKSKGKCQDQRQEQMYLC